MFKCAIPHENNKSVGPAVKPIKIVTQKRQREYTNEVGKVSYGWEIVKEQNFCKDHVPN